MNALSELLGECPEIRAVRETVRRLLAHGTEGRRLPALLILGETGTGKGLLVRALHRAGPRAAGPLVEVNCAAIPETLLEAELFGFERGAFTDARQPKPGLFQTAHGGILFLDEVGLLPERVQAKFLKVLEDGAVRRLGSTQSEPADVAIAAATSEDLPEAVRGRRFREDLYHRLAVVTLRLPSLAERGSDILLLAQHFLGRACADYGLVPKTLTPDARASLLAHPWPGNIRELANVMERAALLTETPLVTAEALGLPATPGLAGTAPEPRARPRPFRDAMGTVERERLVEALDETDWNIARAAARLQIPRGTLRYRIEKLGLRRNAPGAARVAPAAGSSLRDPAAAPPPPAQEPRVWERRRLAFLRAVLVPPPEREVMPFAARALEVLVEKVESFGGRVEELGPLGVVGVFGLDPIEDAPRRAAHAAVAIRRAAERTRSPTADRVGARIAIHASQGLVGPAGETAVIDAEAKCQAYAALEGLVASAEPDTILVSAAAAPALERRFELVPLGPADSRGGPSYRLEGFERPGLAPRGQMTPLVGRGPELEQLRHALARAAAGHGQVVAIVGEPGVGKSRLVWEVMRAHRGRGWLILHVSALSYGQARAYGPVIELLRVYFQIDDRDDPPQIREKVRGQLLALDPALAPSLDALLALLDIPLDDSSWQALDPPQRRQRTLDALKRLWLREAQARPVLLVVEDLHWVDAETQALLDCLVASLPTARLCLLVDYRPEYQHGWGSKTSYSQLRVDPLPPESAQELLRTLLGEDLGLERLTALLIERTEGNPFFLEETVQTLVETQALGGERGARSLARPIDTIQVPATVEAVLSARIDRLSPEVKRLLQTSAVIGKDVAYPVLQAVAEMREENLQRGLARLQAAEFLEETSLFPETVYTFKHALTHEVAYGSLLDDRRRALHARVLDAMERAEGGRHSLHAERLAYHALNGAEWARAARYLHLAGQRAIAQARYESGVSLYEAALRALEQQGEDADLELKLDAYLELYTARTECDWVEGVQELTDKADALARMLNDRERLAQVRVRQAQGLWFLWSGPRRLAEAIERAREAFALATPDDLRTRSYAQFLAGAASVARGRFQEAIQEFDAGVTLFRTMPAKAQDERLMVLPIWANIRAWESEAYAALGDFGSALAVADEAEQIANDLGHANAQGFAGLYAGHVLLTCGQMEAATHAFERGQASGMSRGPNSLGLALACLWLGQRDEGLRVLAQALEIIGDPLGPWARIVNRYGIVTAGAYLAAGLPEQAEAEAARGLALAILDDARVYHVPLSRLLAESLALQGKVPRMEEAVSTWRQLIDLATELSMRPELAHCHLGLGKLYRGTGDEATAQEHLTTATTMYREMDMGFWLTQAEAVLGMPG